jgi:16S rRNA pseudouridine516 synthase
MAKIYLHQFLSKTGVFSSKKDILSAIANSEISIDGRITTKPMFQFSAGKKKVYYRKKRVEVVYGNSYFIMNKPEGYLSARLTEMDITYGKKSVFDLIKVDEKIHKSLFAVGRLDENTTGLLIITNDGKLGISIADPDKNIEKTYDIVLKDRISSEDIKKIENGIVIKLEENGVYSDYKTKPCRIKKKSERQLEVTVTEGKKREVRRMFEALNNKAIKLCRISIGKIKLSELNIKEGEYKAVNKEFIETRI